MLKAQEEIVLPTGSPVPILEGVSRFIHSRNSGTETGVAQFAFSASGSLAYVGGQVFPERQERIVWVDRNGAVEPVRGIPPGKFSAIRLSPDQLKVAVNKDYKRPSIWIYDLKRGTFAPETHEGSSFYPTWTPNGEALAMTSNLNGSLNLFLKHLDGGTDPLFASPQRDEPGSFSPDGNELAFVHTNEETIPNSPDIWIWSMESRSARPLLSGLFREMYPEFSPDGRWLAYNSHASGKGEVYIRPYPGPGRSVPISTTGGSSPVWSGDGSELFYSVRVGGKVRMYAVEITVEEGELIPGNPAVLFEGNYGSTNPIRSYDVTKDGQRFLMRQMPGGGFRAMAEQYLGRKVSIVLNWSEELNRRVPTDE